MTNPITAALVAGETTPLREVALDGGAVYWTEGRPREGGRAALLRRDPSGQIEELLAAPWDVRTRAHEYGGGAFTVADGLVCFVHFEDQRIYRLAAGAAPQPLTPPGPYRYADLVLDTTPRTADGIPRTGGGRLICVREDHTDPRPAGAVNTLVAVPLDGGGGTVLAAGHDFYSNPRLSPDGLQLAWLSWDHPNMPWDGTDLWTAAVRADGSLGEAQHVAGGPGESIFQPEWSPDGVLYFVSDRTGWWNLYRYRDGAVEPLTPMEAEFGAPQWVFGMRTYAFAGPESIVCAYTSGGTWRLALLDGGSGALEPIDQPYTDIRAVHAGAGRAVFLGGSPAESVSLVEIDTPMTGLAENRITGLPDDPMAGLLHDPRVRVLRRSFGGAVPSEYISTPESVEFPTEGGLTAYGLFYRPRNPELAAGERPPLLVMSHGGPTGAASSALNLTIQYWTSRGFAVLDVNYGGSTGYGRAYRERLNGRWGIVDVDDCVNGARFLARQGLVDGERLLIRGGSAGGYTTLCALTFRDAFRAGASYYGIGDLEALAADTHKFESHYLDRLIGPYPERRDLYRERSPIHFTDRLSCPLIIFQGSDDRVVPPSQAEQLADALRRKGLPFVYVLFPGEQHGFRRAENVQRALEEELSFYIKILGSQEPGPRL